MKNKKRIRKAKLLFNEPNDKSSVLIKRPRVIEVCKIYNISTKTLIDYLEQFPGLDNLTSSTLLTEELLPLIDKEFLKSKNIKDRIRGKTKVNFINSKNIPQALKPLAKVGSTNDLNFKHRLLHLENNIFNKQKQLITSKGLPILSSCFTDIEAIGLCSKMSSSYTRYLCAQINNPSRDKNLLIYQIHYIANKALNIFGGYLLTFIYQLRNLHFKNHTALEITSYDKVIPDFPIISFSTGDSSYKIAFFLKRNRKNRQLKSDIRLFSSKNFEQVGFIDEQGYVISKLEKFKPQLSLFYETSLNGNFKISSGVETGNCELCSRTLTHPTSLRIGIGPVCAKNHNIDSTIYKY